MVAFNEFQHLVYLIYIIPSLMLYSIVLYVIQFGHSKAKFDSSFYWLFRFSAICYMIHTICYYIVFRFTSTIIFYTFVRTWPTESWIYVIIYSLSYYSTSATHIYNLAISFNRFTIFALKTKHNTFWNQNLKLILYVCIFGSLIFIWSIPFNSVKNTPVGNDSFIISLTNLDYFPWWNPYKNGIIEICISSTLSLGMNIYVVYSIFKLRFTKSQNGFHISPQDSALIPYSLLVFLTEIFVGAIHVLRVMDNTAFLSFIVNVQFIVVDISDLMPIWFVFVTNKQLRKEVLKLFFKSLSIKISPSSVHHTFLQTSSPIQRLSQTKSVNVLIK